MTQTPAPHLGGTPVDEQACNNCAYFRAAPDHPQQHIADPGGLDGWCRRHAPGPVSHVGDLSSPAVAWPGVQGADWCGEWKEP
jgi:hypothetical protein